jgi:hypothetical protein
LLPYCANAGLAGLDRESAQTTQSEMAARLGDVVYRTACLAAVVWAVFIFLSLLPYAAFDRFNLGFDQLSLGYGNLTRRLVRGTVIVLVGYAGLIGVAGRLHFSRETELLPTGEVPKRND